MPSSDQQDTAVSMLDVMAGLGASPNAIADEHTANDVSHPPKENQAMNKQTDQLEKLGMTEKEREKAAIIIQVRLLYCIHVFMKRWKRTRTKSRQRNYRGYKTRRELKGLGLDASTRWLEVRTTYFPLLRWCLSFAV